MSSNSRIPLYYLLKKERDCGATLLLGHTHTLAQLHYTHCLRFNKTNPHGEKLRCNSQTLRMDSPSSASGCERLFLTPSDHTNLKHAKSIKKRFSLCQEITSYLQAALNEYYDQNPVTPRRYSTILPESFIVTLIHLEILKPSIWNTIVDLTNIYYKKTT